MADLLKQAIFAEAHRLGFSLAGVISPDPPPHLDVFQNWIAAGRHGAMAYLADERARARRADPRLILPECRSMLVLAAPYDPPPTAPLNQSDPPRGRVAAYAPGADYHLALPPRLQALVDFIEQRVGHPVPNRYYTDTGPVLERDLAMRAGLGWIGKNTCLINPKHGSYLLLAEILLGLDLEPDAPFVTDHCGTCTRCITACPTDCILPDRTIDATRCISYLTIELKTDIPEDLREKLGNWVFGCDVCQQVCPWNRFAAPHGDQALAPRDDVQAPNLIQELALTPTDFNRKFKDSPVKRAKRRGYLRNIVVALGNSRDPHAMPALEKALTDSEPLVRQHAAWAIEQIKQTTAKDFDMQTRWNALWLRLGVDQGPSFDDVRARYEEHHRHYHTLAHIHECLEWYDRQRNPDDTLELAIWLHDLIYDPHARDNEERSCLLARQWLEKFSIAPKHIARIERLILATKHTQSASAPDEIRIVDIDLAILGAVPERFWSYEEQIRKEYAWVALPRYRSARAAIMQGFLNRPDIYHSAFMQTHLEKQARANVQRLIEKLTG